MNNSVFLVRLQRRDGLVVLGHNGLLSIWTTRELADSAVLYYRTKGKESRVEEWKMNVSFEQLA